MHSLWKSSESPCSLWFYVLCLAKQQPIVVWSVPNVPGTVFLVAPTSTVLNVLTPIKVIREKLIMQYLPQRYRVSTASSAHKGWVWERSPCWRVFRCSARRPSLSSARSAPCVSGCSRHAENTFHMLAVLYEVFGKGDKHWKWCQIWNYDQLPSSGFSSVVPPWPPAEQHWEQPNAPHGPCSVYIKWDPIMQFFFIYFQFSLLCKVAV